MCSVFGVLGQDLTQTLTEAFEQFEKLAITVERRGQDAFGAFSVNQQGQRLGLFKNQGDVATNISSSLYKQFKKESLSAGTLALSLVGHTRLATHGDISCSENNQPVFTDDWIVVHNGIIINEKEIKKSIQTKHSSTDLDTFALISVLDQLALKADENPLRLFAEIQSKISGANTFIIYSLKFKKFYLYSSNGSLYFSVKNKVVYFASEAIFLQKAFAFKKNEITQIDKKSFAIWSPFHPSISVFANIDSDQKSQPPVQSLAVNAEVPQAQPQPSLQPQISLFLPSKVVAAPMSYVKNNAIELLISEYKKNEPAVRALRRCKSCLLPETFPGIVFSESSCNVCHNYEKQLITKNLSDLRLTLEKNSQNPSQNILVGLSGGRDSSFVLHTLVKELGLNVKAFTYDWGMVTDLARRNQSRLCGDLDVEHILVAADIKTKRDNIRKNIEAWLRRPSLGIIPLFMAGDKHYFYYAEKIRQELNCSSTVMGESKLEKTGFKTKFAGVEQKGKNATMAYGLSVTGKAQMLFYYGKEFLVNSKYWNSSLLDTFTGYLSYYVHPHDYINLYDYIEWKEDTVDTVLKRYDWEFSKDSKSSWRVGDGTSAFYNYIYHTVCGFTENDTLRANQIREGHLNVETARGLIDRDNYPRIESFLWYCEVLNLNPEHVIAKINEIPKLYPC